METLDAASLMPSVIWEEADRLCKTLRYGKMVLEVSGAGGTAIRGTKKSEEVGGIVEDDKRVGSLPME